MYTALKRWAEAQEFFEICACSPGSAAAAIQMEALKKLVLVQLIREGKVGRRCLEQLPDRLPADGLRQTTPPPKYIHPVLPRLLKGTPYSAFVNAYPDQRAELRSIVEGELVFTTVRTLGDETLSISPFFWYGMLIQREIGEDPGIDPSGAGARAEVVDQETNVDVPHAALV